MSDEGLTVRELIALLEQQDPNARPMAWVAYYGKRLGTVQLYFHREAKVCNDGRLVLLPVGPRVEGDEAHALADMEVDMRAPGLLRKLAADVLGDVDNLRAFADRIERRVAGFKAD
jgi:hypothetical protein